MQISATLLADSISRQGVRLTTFELYYHRYILPELNTHRDFTRNGASSRAIPTAKLIETCLAERVEPLEWGLAQSGMQAFNVADPVLEAEGREIWDEARADAVRHASRLSEKGFAKQIVNRILEPYLPTKTVLSSTNWANFDALRDHKDAQPEIRELARQVIAARAASTPAVLGPNGWHLPYVTAEDRQTISALPIIQLDEIVQQIMPMIAHPGAFRWYEDIVLAMISAARCARASYRLVDGAATTIEKDLELFSRLVKEQPVHASPTEHQGMPEFSPHKTPLTGNYRGWIQFRKLLKNETVHDHG